MAENNQITYFISGHMDITKEEFDLHYRDKIIEAAKNPGSKFIMGSAPGADFMAQQLLLKLLENDPECFNRITVCYKGNKPECVADNRIDLLGGFQSHDSKDGYMTIHSNVDIAYVRSVEESQKLYGPKFDPTKISGTQKNLERRKMLQKN